VDQLPENLRPALYIKDDDFFQSYSNGNFITLTNITEKDLEKIIKFRIEPLHISLHSFNSSIRSLMFGSVKSERALKNFAMLDSNGIRTNIQIVLCPGINDDVDLKNTLDTLCSNYKKVLSVGIVPVGITRYNRSSLLKPFDESSSSRLINFIDNYKKTGRRQEIASKIFAADEFFIMARKEFPDYSYYGRFLQLKNGIGKAADFLNEMTGAIDGLIRAGIFTTRTDGKGATGDSISKTGAAFTQDDFKKYSCCQRQNRILLVTSEYGEYVLKIAFDLIGTRIKNLTGLKQESLPDVLPVKNAFLGGNIRVTGLLTGNDIIEALKHQNLQKYEKILVPDCIFNNEGLTIDNTTVELIKNINPCIKFINESGKSLVNEIFI